MRSNFKDWVHIKTVMLSNRKLALSLDQNFCYDVLNYPGHRAQAATRPEDLPYR